MVWIEVMGNLPTGKQKKGNKLNINKCISKAFQHYGYSMENSDKEIEFHPLNIRITGELDFVDDSNSENVHSRLIIKTRHEEIFPNGIFEYAYGWGKDIEEASVNAAYRWIESDFNTFHDLLCESESHDHEKNKMELVSMSTEDEILGWEVVFGNVIYPESETRKLEINQNEIFLSMFDLITGTLLNEKGAYGIKYFAMQDEKGNVELDCRLNCHNWEDGKMELEKYVSNWEIQNEAHWIKQYILIVNKKLDELKNKEELLQELANALEKQLEDKNRKEKHSKSNWKFWRKE